jgi:hypothetical protein
MRHASADSLERLSELLIALRCEPKLSEKGSGKFYAKNRAFIHFHEDPNGLFADVRFGAEFERVSVDSQAEQRKLLDAIRKHLSST